MIPHDISASEINNLIDEWITGQNGERNRRILKRRLIDGIHFELLAEEFNMSTRHVKNIVYKGEVIIFRHCKQ